MKVNKLVLGIAALSLSGSAIAQAQTGGAAKPCLSDTEVETLVTFVLPGLVEGISGKCRAILAPNAFLSTSAPALAARYRTESPVDWNRVRPLVDKLGGDQFPLALGGEFGVKLVEAAVTTAIVGEIKTKDCGTANRVTEALAPLPAANTAKLAGMLLELGMKDDERSSDLPFRLCPAVVAAR